MARIDETRAFVPVNVGLQKGIFAAVIGGGLGFYIPTLVLYVLKKSRQDRIFLSLPDALDLFCPSTAVRAGTCNRINSRSALAAS